MFLTLAIACAIQGVLALGTSATAKADTTALQPPFFVTDSALLDIAFVNQLAPVQTLGDVNADGYVNSDDVAAIENAVASYDGVDHLSVDAACGVCADMNVDGDLSDADIGLLWEILEMGEGFVDTPPVTTNTLFRYDTSMSMIATQTVAAPGDAVPVMFLGHTVTQADEFAKVTFDEGVGVSITKDYSKNAFVVSVDPNAAYFSSVSLDVEMRDGSGNTMSTRSLTIQVVDPAVVSFDLLPESTSVPMPDVVGDIEDPIPAQCPQLDLECQALVVDFSGSDAMQNSAGPLEDALVGIGCATTWVSIRQEPIPPNWLAKSGLNRKKFESSGEFPGWIRRNKTMMEDSRTLIAQYAERVNERGAETAIEVVRGHGSGTGGCGRWSGNSASSYGFYLKRADFHKQMYDAADHRVCEKVAIDLSCYAGRTAHAYHEVMNTGRLPSCLFYPPENPPEHAGYSLDYGRGTSASCTTTTTSANNSMILDLAQGAWDSGSGAGFSQTVLGMPVDPNAPVFGWPVPATQGAEYLDYGYTDQTAAGGPVANVGY